MKVGILTHYAASSHGALLQMYGLKEELENLGHDVYILTYTRNLDFIDEQKKQRFSASFKNIPYYVKSYMGEDGIGCLFYQYKKQKKLNKFRKDNFKFIPYTLSKNLDCVVIGADEVLSLENGINIMMYGHCITSKSIIYYAPSFGQTDLKRINYFGCKEVIESGLRRISSLSARDDGTKKIMDCLLGCDIPIVCDPALLHKFNYNKKKSLKKYIVVYSYQSNFKDHERIEQIKKYAKKKKCEIWSVGVYYRWCDKRINCNPIEMIDVFANAEAILTDTFHGTITSYIAHTPMAVFVRNNNNVKLDHLLKITGLSERKVFNPYEIEKILEKSVNFEEIDKKIEILRTQGLKYLTCAMNSEEL